MDATPVVTDSRVRLAFLLLILLQAAHSVEEYVYRLYDVFPPARFVSRLFSEDPAAGFVIANVLIVTFGLWCYVARVRANYSSAHQWLWPWVVVEAVNGVVHLTLAVLRSGYFPGAVTAPLLAGVSFYLAVRLSRSAGRKTGRYGT
jgi:hypothetical protein